MFWLKRLKEENDESSWALAYGDLMSLLLAVFVMIAAMSELRAGRRFDEVRDGVRGAFGFSGMAAHAELLPGAGRSLSLVERLAAAGLESGTTHGSELTDDALAPCDIVLQEDRLILRIAGSAAYEAHSARLLPTGRRALARLAEYLVAGQAILEIRGHGGDGPVPAEAPFRDALDLSYERARQVASVLIEMGLDPARLELTACGDRDPLVLQPTDHPLSEMNRRIEIIVHSTGGGTNETIADNQRGING